MNIDPSDAYIAIEKILWTKRLAEGLVQMRSILEKNPRVVLEQDAEGRTLLSQAALFPSPEYCKVLLEFDRTGETLRMCDVSGILPLHVACECANIDTARYLLEMHPDSINVTDNMKRNCLHMFIESICVAFCDRERIIEFAGFLLKNAPGLISSTTRNGDLPLHIACSSGRDISVIEFLYNAYPEAIYARDSNGNTPLAAARADEREALVSFLQDQSDVLAEAKNVRTPDTRGQFPIHRAIFNEELPRGTMQLMLSENTDSLGHADSDGNFLIHMACARGKSGIVNSILERSDAGLSIQNNEGKIPIQLLLYDSDVDRNSLEYVQAVNALLREHPDAVMHLRA
jgi:ankyrin repeat protein